MNRYSFYNCSKLNSFNSSENNFYNIPVNVKGIGSHAFFGAGKNVSNGFSAKVEAMTLNDYSFAESGLREINLPNATLILSNAFYGCKKLKKVTLGKDNVEVDENAFDNDSKLTIYVKTEELQKKLQEKFNNVNVEIIN